MAYSSAYFKGRNDGAILPYTPAGLQKKSGRPKGRSIALEKVTIESSQVFDQEVGGNPDWLAHSIRRYLAS